MRTLEVRKFKCTSRAGQRHLLVRTHLHPCSSEVRKETSRPALRAYVCHSWSQSIRMAALQLRFHVVYCLASSHVTFLLLKRDVELSRILPRLGYSRPTLCPFMPGVFHHLWELDSSLPRMSPFLNSRYPHLKMPSVS